MKRSITSLVVLLAAPLALVLTGCDGPALCAQVARDAGFPQSSMVIAVAIAMAESGCQPDATGTNPPSDSCPHGSRDRGLWQINSCWHPDVLDECAYDPNCNAKEALRISDQGTNWSPWSAYKNGSYKQFLDEAEQAVAGL